MDCFFFTRGLAHKSLLKTFTLEDHRILCFVSDLSFVCIHRDALIAVRRRLNRKLFGTNWRKTGTRLQWVHNYEHTSGNSHTHSVCKLCEGVDATEFKRQARHIWGKLTTGNNEAQLWIDKIKNQKAVAAYMLKGGSTDYTHA